MNNWPLQTDCDTFYGNPRDRDHPEKPSVQWMAANLSRVKPPFRMFYGGIQVPSIQIHKKCAGSLAKILDNIWDAAEHDQKVIDKWGMSVYGGSFNYRLMRGLSVLSMHSYGCAVDFDPARNDLHNAKPNFASIPEVVQAFKNEGWVWGGDWPTRPDGMHFQAARVK